MGLDLDYFTCCQLLLFSIDTGDSRIRYVPQGFHSPVQTSLQARFYPGENLFQGFPL